MICGTPLVCEALAKPQKPALVLYSSHASPATRKKIENKCAYYGVPAITVPATPEALAHAVGKIGCLAAVAVTDSGFAEALEKKLSQLTEEPQGNPLAASPDAENPT